MSQEALIEQAKQKFLEEIDEIVNIEGVEDDEAFSRWICRNFLRIDDESDEEDAVEVGGAGDRSVDFFWMDETPDTREEQSISWGEAKFSRNLNREFDSTFLDHLGESIGKLEDPPITSNRAFKNCAEEFRAAGGVDSPMQKRIYICVAGKITPQVQEDIAEGSSWRVRHLSRTHGPKIEIIVIDLDKIVQHCIQAQTGPVQVTFSDTAKNPAGEVIGVIPAIIRTDSVTGKNSVFGYVNGNELLKLKRNEANTLFAQNVRQGLGNKTRPNKNMIATLQDPEKKQKFWKYNNGVTAICEKFELVENTENKFLVTNINIVNGRQTTLCLEENRAFVDDDVLVGLTIHEAIDVEERNKISEATNTQNPVVPIDLISNNDDLVLLESSCNRDYNRYFFERQRGGFSHDPVTRADRTRITGLRRMKKGDVARAFYAFNVDAYEAIKTSDEKLYNDQDVFYPRIFRVSVKELIFAHVLSESIKGLLKTWRKQIEQHREGQPITLPDLWHEDETDTLKEILNKKQIRYVLLSWIKESLDSFSDDDQVTIKTNMIERFGNIARRAAIPEEFLHIINAAITNFRFCFDVIQHETWPEDEDGNRRQPSPIEMKERIANDPDSADVIRHLLDTKANQIEQQRAGGTENPDPIKSRLENFL